MAGKKVKNKEENRKAMQAGKNAVMILNESGEWRISIPEGMADLEAGEYALGQAPAVTLVDLGETLVVCPDPVETLRSAAGYCRRTGAELVFSMPNAFFEDRIVEQYFLDQIPEIGRAMTLSSIRKMLMECGYEITQIHRERGKKERIEKLERTAPAVADEVKYFSDLTIDRSYIRNYVIRCRVTDVREKAMQRPFLSVVIRTMGNRIQELKEVFLCLNAQEDQDFEVLIMIHNAEEEEAAEVEALLEFVPEPMREKYRFIPVSGGTRSRPLNAAIDQVRGTYFASVDDDDIILANWVEAFRKGATEAQGQIIHTFAAVQEWSRHGKDLRSESEKDNFYCQAFDRETQYRTNRCPFMTLAFPTDLVRRLKYRFDEELNTAEDWDFLMRVSTITGVHDVKECTAIYRKWNNAENSTTLFTDRQRWQTEVMVRNGFRELRTVSKLSDTLLEEKLDKKSKKMKVTRKAPEGPKLEPEIRFGDQMCHANYLTRHGQKVVMRFDHPFEAEKRGRVRIDPFIDGGFLLKAVTVYFFYEDGSAEKYTGRQVKSNGLRRGDTIYFFFSDPQIYVDIPAVEDLEAVEVVCARSNELMLRQGFTLLPAAFFSLIRQTIGLGFRKVWSRFVS